MALLSDLKHQLYNNHYINNKDEIIFDIPIIIKLKNNSDSMVDEITLTKIIRIGNRLKVLDEYNNQWTLSKLSSITQGIISNNLLSMKDKRYPFKQFNLPINL